MAGSEITDAGVIRWQDASLVLHPSCLLFVGLASVVLLGSVVRAQKHEMDSHLRRDKGPDEEIRFTFGAQQAVAMPFFSSAALLLLFFCFKYIQGILVFIICTTSGVGLAFTCYPLMEMLSKRLPWLNRPAFSVVSFSTVVLVKDVCLCIAVLVTLMIWLCTGSFVLNNALGIGLCALMVSLVNVPNLKICTVLLTLLFFYDIFWVFFSERIFGSNVMVDAATQPAGNPAKYLLADVLHLSNGEAIPAQLEMPMKLVVPWSLVGWGANSLSGEFLMLGLGDIGLPGMLLAYLLSTECARNTTPSLVNSLEGILRIFIKSSYVFRCWIGYIVGLVCTLFAGMVFQAPQPALLFLVPCTLLPILLQAYTNGDLRPLWEGYSHDIAGTAV